MRKLGDTKTVRLFVPVSVEMRDQFEASCNGETMASVMREMIAERIKKKPNRNPTPVFVHKAAKRDAKEQLA